MAQRRAHWRTFCAVVGRSGLAFKTKCRRTRRKVAQTRSLIYTRVVSQIVVAAITRAGMRVDKHSKSARRVDRMAKRIEIHVGHFDVLIQEGKEVQD